MKLIPCEANPNTMKEHRSNGDYPVDECFALDNGCQLHRFRNAAGVEYSAIYNKDGMEFLNNERSQEAKMLELFETTWNRGIF